MNIEYRQVAPIGVDFPHRLIEVRVMPYETETVISERGRTFREVVARGAFQGIDPGQRRINVNPNHDMEKIIGRVVSCDTGRADGLVAELYITKADDGDAILTKADEGLLDASAGFGVMDGGESWPERGLRRLTKLWLDHVAMTPTPAYQTANVLAVRNVQRENEPPTPTPLLDQVYAWRLAERYAMLGGDR